MSYQLYLTSQGATKLAAAATAGGSVHLTQFVVGQGVGVDFSQRLAAQTLTDPKYQGAIESISPTDTPHQYAVACVLPPTAGGFTIGEVGLIDSDGTLIWVGSLPSVQKPDSTSPAAVDYRINCLVSVDNYNGAVTLVIDPNVVTATRQWTQQWTQSWVEAHYFDQSQMTAQIGALQQQLTALLARPFEGIPLGGILTTSKDYANGEAVAADLGYGHWVRYGKGLTLVGHDPAVTAGGSPAWWATLGNITGEFSHTLTIDEMPSHTHKVADTIGISGQGGGWDMNSNASNFIDSAGVQHTGGDKPHNNIQPSVVVAFWLRVADPATANVPQLYNGTDASTLTHAVTPAPPTGNNTNAQPVATTATANNIPLKFIASTTVPIDIAGHAVGTLSAINGQPVIAGQAGSSTVFYTVSNTDAYYDAVKDGDYPLGTLNWTADGTTSITFQNVVLSKLSSLSVPIAYSVTDGTHTASATITVTCNNTMWYIQDHSVDTSGGGA